jgi:hypothetical protein
LHQNEGEKKQMKRRITVLFLLMLASSCMFAQLTIDNPKHLNFPESQAQVLLEMSCRAVAKELHLADESKIRFGLRLVIGQEDERFSFDEKTGTPTLFLREWDAGKFATAAVRFAVRRSIGPERQQEIILDMLRRSEKIAPVSAAHLHGFVELKSQSPQRGNDCLRGIADSSLREVHCDSIAKNKHSMNK